MQNKFTLYILFIGITMFWSCNDLNLQVAEPDVPVVESYLNPGTDFSVKVFKQLIYSSNDTNYTNLNDLNITITYSDMEYPLTFVDSGVYNNSSITINPEQEYTVQFNYNNKDVNASTIVPNKPEDFKTSSSTIEVFSMSSFTPGNGGPPTMPDPITLSWSNSSNTYHMIVVETTEDDPTLIDSNTDRPARTFRNAPTLNTSQELDGKNFTYYGQHRIVLFSLNTEYAALYEQLGNSSLDIVAPPSNINNGLGIFTGINADTLYVNVTSQ